MSKDGGRDREASGERGAELLRLVAVMDRLRVECPWDARQTHQSLAPFLLEETYETIDALDRGDLAELRGELGDVLLQVMFHSRIAAERTDGTGFTIDDVAAGIADKLVRRHPHVFADVSVSGADEVNRNWDQIKAEERVAAGRAADSVLDSVPMSQPALSLAAQLQRRAERAGAPAAAADLRTAAGNGAGAEVAGGLDVAGGAEVAGSPEVAGEAEAAGGAEIPGGTGRAGGTAGEDPVSDIGAELFALVARARAAGLDPELELRRAARVYRDRVRAWESAVARTTGTRTTGTRTTGTRTTGTRTTGTRTTGTRTTGTRTTGTGGVPT